MERLSIDPKNYSFWTKEYRIPLFVLTNPIQSIFATNTLFIYEKSQVELFVENNQIERYANDGLALFKNKEKQFNEMAGIKDKIIKFSSIITASDFRNRELATELFLENLKLIASYSNVYSKTEPFYTAKVKDAALLQEIGEERLKLKESSRGLYKALLAGLLPAVSKGTDVSPLDLLFYEYKELLEFINDGTVISKTEVAKRKKGYCLKNSSKSELFTDAPFKRLKYLFTDDNKSTVITGRRAMQGHVKGKATVIVHNKLNLRDFAENFKEGEILVTEMTRPDLFFICKKAAAIVTDEGGMSCHAAILAREFGIPCVVGTERATKVIKSGDLVEVDADNGVVRLI